MTLLFIGDLNANEQLTLVMGGLLIGGFVGYRYIDRKRYGEGTLIGAGVGALTMPFIWQVLVEPNTGW